MDVREQLQIQDKLSLSLIKGHKDQLAVEANCFIKLFGPDGVLKDSREVHNTVTTAGKNGIADQMLAAPTLAKMGWLAIGTGTPSGTLLGAEAARVAFDTRTRSTNVVTVVATFGAGVGTGAITEAGTFNIVTANTVDMWMSTSFAVVNKGAGDTIVVTWTLTFN